MVLSAGPGGRGGEADPSRVLVFEAVFNFRDIGGYRGLGGRPVRWRRLFRADGLHRLTPADEPLVRELELATVIDLRTPDEISARGRFPEELGPVTFHHLPLFDVVPDWSEFPGVDSPGFLAERYIDMLETGRGSIQEVLHLLAEPAVYPAVFHCAAGKDRTGIVASLVLSLLGVDDETIVDDYALSQPAMAALDEWMLRKHPEAATDLARRPRAVFSAAPSTMHSFLAEVRRAFGSIEGLVADLGVDHDVIGRMRDLLLA